MIKGAVDLAIRLADWLGSSAARDSAGSFARSIVENGLGAAERSYDLVTTLLSLRERAPDVSAGGT